MSEELKPCPCCNSKAAIHDGGKGLLKFVYCTKCDLATNAFSRTSDAIDVWNNRPPQFTLITPESMPEIGVPCIVIAEGRVGYCKLNENKTWIGVQTGASHHDKNITHYQTIELRDTIEETHNIGYMAINPIAVEMCVTLKKTLKKLDKPKN